MDFKSVCLIAGYEAFSNYEINSAGVLRNILTRRILKWDPTGQAKLNQNGNIKGIQKKRSINILFHDNEEIYGMLSSITGFEDPIFESYEVFKNADIRSTTGKRAYSTITYCKDTLGYLFTRIQGRTILKHRLLALMYLENPEGKDCVVDHIDGNPSNNELSNLRWCSQRENNMNRGKSKNNTSGVPNIYATMRGERKCWEIHIKKTNEDGSRTRIQKTFKRETQEIPSYIIQLRHELVKELFGEFAREIS
jgi:hypothetical protein